jgi:hypothetical protein
MMKKQTIEAAGSGLLGGWLASGCPSVGSNSPGSPRGRKPGATVTSRPQVRAKDLGLFLDSGGGCYRNRSWFWKLTLEWPEGGSERVTTIIVFQYLLKSLTKVFNAHKIPER